MRKAFDNLLLGNMGVNMEQNIMQGNLTQFLTSIR